MLRQQRSAARRAWGCACGSAARRTASEELYMRVVALGVALRQRVEVFGVAPTILLPAQRVPALRPREERLPEERVRGGGRRRRRARVGLEHGQLDRRARARRGCRRRRARATATARRTRRRGLLRRLLHVHAEQPAAERPQKSHVHRLVEADKDERVCDEAVGRHGGAAAVQDLLHDGEQHSGQRNRVWERGGADNDPVVLRPHQRAREQRHQLAEREPDGHHRQRQQ